MALIALLASYRVRILWREGAGALACKAVAVRKASYIKRCSWAGDEPLMRRYHDLEWGKPLHDDRRLFELLILEGAQAGLSWRTILNKREAYRRAFDGFDPKRVAKYDAVKIRRLMADPGIVRNRLKIESAVRNARAMLAIQQEHGSFDAFVWRFVNGSPMENRVRSASDVPAKTKESDALSGALAQAGFKFVGSTICYAFMQAAGLVNDHLVTCAYRNSRGGASARARERPTSVLRR
jgi:DNA-3-methyladenine glycosylase I